MVRIENDCSFCTLVVIGWNCWSRWSPEWMCIVDMGRAMPRIPKSEFHRMIKPSPVEAERNSKVFLWFKYKHLWLAEECVCKPAGIMTALWDRSTAESTCSSLHCTQQTHWVEGFQSGALHQMDSSFSICVSVLSSVSVISSFPHGLSQVYRMKPCRI